MPRVSSRWPDASWSSSVSTGDKIGRFWLPLLAGREAHRAPADYERHMQFCPCKHKIELHTRTTDYARVAASATPNPKRRIQRQGYPAVRFRKPRRFPRSTWQYSPPSRRRAELQGDCPVSWIYQTILTYEEQHSERFIDPDLTHDAERSDPPDELQRINFYSPAAPLF